jgi:hypothetical protein
MSGACTNCGGKGACNARKGAMFDAIEEALGRLYPTRCWSDRDEAAGFGSGLAPGEGDVLARSLAARLRAGTLYRPGAADETCDYVYVLCVGRSPSLIELREAALDAGVAAALRASVLAGPVEEVYLRVALSTLARFAAVQEVELRASATEDGEVTLTETPRAGVFAPPLLARLQALVGVLGEMGIRHLDFGEIIEPPHGFDPGDYAAKWGGVPAIANYFFYPQSPSSITTGVT